MHLYCEELPSQVSSFHVYSAKEATGNKTFLQFASRVSSPHCLHRGTDEEDVEACKQSPPCALSPDPCESSSVQLGRMRSLSLTSLLFQRRAESLFFTAGAPTSSSLSPCQCGVMESDFRTVRRLIPFVPPIMGLERGRQRTCPDVCGEVSDKEGPTMVSLLALVRVCCSFRPTKQV